MELGADLVFNGDFDFGDVVPSGWQFTVEADGQRLEYVTEGTDHHISFFAPLVEDVPWPEARLIQPFEVAPHRDYRLGVEARTVTQGRLFLALIFLDEDGDQILLRGPGEPEISDSEWETIEATLESPVNAAQAVVVMRLAVRPDLSTASSSSVDVNSVSVREVLD